MSTKDQLVQEIDQAPEYLLEEALNFFLLPKLRLPERAFTNPSTTAPQDNTAPLFLQKAQEISQRLSQDQAAVLPTDLAKKLDHYLHGAPKTEA